MPVSITIPIFPHLKKFIQKEFGLPLLPDDHSTLGKMITLSLRGRNRNQITKQPHNSPIQWNLTNSIEIPLTTDQQELNPNKEKLIRLNIHLNTLFKEHLVIWVQAQRQMGVKALTSIKWFREYYNLAPDEFKTETAHRHYMRAMKKNFRPLVIVQKNSRKKKRRKLLKDNITGI